MGSYVKHSSASNPKSEAPDRVFNVPTKDENLITLRIAEPNLRADGLSLTTWTSADILSRQLHRIDVDFTLATNEVPVLELGAGTGLVGISAALLWQQKVVLTDLPQIVPGLRANIDINAQYTPYISKAVQCGDLDWRHPDLLTLEDGSWFRASEGVKATVIFAADTVYDEDHPELVSRAVLTWLARTRHARAIICYALRVAYLDQVRELWDILEAAGLEAESHGQDRTEQEFDDERLCEWVIWRWKDSEIQSPQN